MILIAGTVALDPQQRESALAAARELFEPTRVQVGCLDYVWAVDTAVEGRIYVYERCAVEPSLAAHFAGPWYRKMLAAIGRHGIRQLGVLEYRIALSELVYDPEGRPRLFLRSLRSLRAARTRGLRGLLQRSALRSGLGPPALCWAGPAREASWLTNPSASTIA
jgi:quinol monooxygenase YgiN